MVLAAECAVGWFDSDRLIVRACMRGDMHAGERGALDCVGRTRGRRDWGRSVWEEWGRVKQQANVRDIGLISVQW